MINEMFPDIIDYISQPIGYSDVKVLRNAFICGGIACVLMVVGLKYLLILILSMFITAIVVVIAWLYTLRSDTRAELLTRIRDVCKTFIRRCIDEVMDEEDSRKDVTAEEVETLPDDTSTSISSCRLPGRSIDKEDVTAAKVEVSHSSKLDESWETMSQVAAYIKELKG